MYQRITKNLSKLTILTWSLLFFTIFFNVPAASASSDLRKSYDDRSLLTSGLWERDSDLPYTSFLLVNEDGRTGYLCHNDGKSLSGELIFFLQDGHWMFSAPPGHGEGPLIIQEIESIANNLIVRGEEKGVLYRQVFRPISQLPEICHSLMRGEVPSFEDFI